MAAATPTAAPAAPAKPSTPAPAASAATPPDAGAASEAQLQKATKSVEEELYALDDARPEPKPGDKAPDKPPGDKPPEKPAGETPPGEKPPGEKTEGKSADELLSDDKEPGKISEVRQAYRTLKAAVKNELKPEIERLQNRVKELETAAPQAGEVVKQFEAVKKRNDELESQIEFLDFKQSKTFQEKYQKPYVEAWARALSDFQRLKVRIPGEIDPQTEQPTFTTRAATQEDLLSLANMDLSEMDAKAHEMFGLSAPRVIAHVEKIRELSAAQEGAIAEAQKTSGERRKAAAAESLLGQNKRNELWQNSNKELVTKYPKLFSEVPEDAKGNELLTKGRLEAERLFNPTKGNRFENPEAEIKGHALMWQKIANHDRLVFWLKRTRAELAEAKKSLDEFEKSEPPGGPGGDGNRAPTGDFMQDVGAELAALDKRG